MMFIKGIATPDAAEASVATTNHTRSEFVEYERMRCCIGTLAPAIKLFQEGVMRGKVPHSPQLEGNSYKKSTDGKLVGL